MASTDLIKAAEETGYMKSLYTTSHYGSLTASIHQVSKDIARQIFGTSTEVQKNFWLSEAQIPDNSWLFSFSSIREKIHQHAGVEMYHVNETEAKKLMDRLKKQQQSMKEKAMEEEQQAKMIMEAKLETLKPQSQRMNAIRDQMQ